MNHFHGIKHLLVDLDGTLLGARDFPLRLEFILRAVRAFKEYGGWGRALKALSAMRSELSHAPPQVVEGLTNDKRAASAFSRVLGLSVVESERALEEVMGTLFPTLKRHFFPISEAKEFLSWANEHYQMTLATNPVWPEHIVKLRVEWAGINSNWFTSMTHAGVMHSCKPAPEYFREVLQRQGLEARECLLIGNDIKMDLPAARVGIRVFIVGKDADLKPLEPGSGNAPSWRGTWSHLRSMLEH